MRSTICISLTALAAPVLAQPVLTQGCFARDYTAAHLDSHPEQLVASMVMRVTHDATHGEDYVWLAATLTGRGPHAGRGLAGAVVDQSLTCWADDRVQCTVDCDGGSFQVIRDDGAVLDLRTEYLTAGVTDGCGGLVNLSESPDRPTTYRLFRVDDAICEERLNP